MVKLTGVEIKNFKGIDNIKIDIEGGRAPGRFITLVGLNESGKTSIIEAIALSSLQDPETADLLKETNTNIDLHDVVPKHLSAGFTGEFEVKVNLDFSDNPEYVQSIEAILGRNKYKISGNLSERISITKQYLFEDSNFVKSKLVWSFSPKVKKANGRNVQGLFSLNREVWRKCLEEIKKLLPRSVYFPTFLVNFPKRVYLEGDYGKVDSYYRAIICDALNGLSQPLSLEKHIIERVNKHRKPGETFSSALRSSNEGRQIDSTVQALAAELNFVVFGAWGEISGRPVKNRQIVIEWHVDEDKHNHVYLEFSILVGDHRFYISERSVGFRWFFSFLLFTQFQGARADGRKIIFLFDEPASHLHPKAQERLMESFKKIAAPNHIIIYSTHSHYLINPLWLEQAYVVENSALDADVDETGIANIDTRVKITADKYKNYVSNNPTRTTYYQPILDVLDQGAGGLDISDPVVILEGKYDYYPFRYLLKEIGREDEMKIIPAVGAGGLSALIGILRGWNVRFLLVLDDDDAGRKEKVKYRNTLMLGENQVCTLDELHPDLKGKEFEGIFQDDLREACVNLGFSSSKKVKKQQFYTYFQTIIANPDAAEPIPDTLEIFGDFVSEIKARLSAQ